VEEVFSGLPRNYPSWNLVNGLGLNFTTCLTSGCDNETIEKIGFKHGNLFDNVKKLKSELAAVQSAMNVDPPNNSLRIEELRVLKEYKSALKDEESFLRP
nr:RNA-directed DNA polymerase, eukaryota, reverse transcriptase zinc-binding domain protein [Tanacetum cinerariifolium]